MKKRKIELSEIALLLVFIFISFRFGFTVYKLEQERPDWVHKDIDINECTSFGYLNNRNRYINMVGDANIQLPILNMYIKDVSLTFSEVKQPINITLYYAENDHGYSEDYKVSVDLNADSTLAYLVLEKEITTCRIDIGTKAGEEFILSSLSLNDVDRANRSINLELYKKFVMYLFSAVCMLALFLELIYKHKMNKEKLFAVLAVGLGVCYLLVMTPLSIPDEPFHYQSSYKLSNYLLFRWDTADYIEEANYNYDQFAAHFNVSTGYLRIMDEFGGKGAASGEKVQFWGTPTYFVEYLPQALGISLGRILNFNFVTMFLLGRFFNLIFYAGCLYFAVKRVPKFKTLFGLIGIMPMTLHQAASYSYDGFINGMAFVLIASIMNALYGEGLLSKKDYNCILWVGVLLAPAKVVYCTILILALFIPKERFDGKRQMVKRTSLLFFAAGVFVMLFQLKNVSRLAHTPDALNYAGVPLYSVEFILRHPIQTIKIFADTFQQSANLWLYCAVGYILSGYSFLVSGPIIQYYILIILLAVLGHTDSDEFLPFYHRAGFLSVTLVVVLMVMLSMFLGWTANGAAMIDGIQGRYFIPVIPLLALSFNNKTFTLSRRIDWALIVAAVWLNRDVLLKVLNHTIGL